MVQDRIYGLIAGQGNLPCCLLTHFKEAGDRVYTVALEGQTPTETVLQQDHIWVKLGTIAPILTYFKEKSVTHVILAGAVRRPSLSELSLDWQGTKLLARIGFNSLGDDGLLSALVSYMEEQGFTIVGADEILLTLTTPRGCLTKTEPESEDLTCLVRAVDVLKKLGAADVGQAAVIQQGLILGLEAIEGTSALIDRTASYRRPGRGGILVKMAKPHQDLRVDLPTIGLETIEKAVHSGLVGIAVEATRSQILDQSKVIALANEHGLFVYGF
jgi:DUF1009 family protein